MPPPGPAEGPLPPPGAYGGGGGGGGRGKTPLLRGEAASGGSPHPWYARLSQSQPELCRRTGPQNQSKASHRPFPHPPPITPLHAGSAARTPQPRRQPIARQTASERRENHPTDARREGNVPPPPNHSAGAAQPGRRYLVRDALQGAELAAVPAEVQLRQRRPHLLLPAHQVQHPLGLQQRRHLERGAAAGEPPHAVRRQRRASARRPAHVTPAGRGGPVGAAWSVRPPASPGAPWPPARRRRSSSSPGSARSGVLAQPCVARRSRTLAPVLLRAGWGSLRGERGRGHRPGCFTRVRALGNTFYCALRRPRSPLNPQGAGLRHPPPKKVVSFQSHGR